MKISSASKKVLAGALSAAMVVAFSPAAALAGTGNLESNVGHKLDSGTVTVAPSCQGDGLMTYTCQDGDGYSIIAAIKGTQKHVYSPNDKVFGVDANGFTWDLTGAAPAATLHLKCAGHAGDTAVTAVVTKTGTEPSFFGAGEVTYTAKAKDANGQEYTSTKTVKSGAWKVANGMSAGDVKWTDGFGVARIDVTSNQAASGDAVNKTQTLTAVSTSKSVAVKEGDPVQAKFTAAFELPAGVLFGTKTGAAPLHIDISTITIPANDADLEGADKAYVKDGKLYVERTITDANVLNTAHTVATKGTALLAAAGTYKKLVSGAMTDSAANDVAGTAYYTEGTATSSTKVNKGDYYVNASDELILATVDGTSAVNDKKYYTFSGTVLTPAAGGNAETFAADGVTITYVGEGKIADGTAKADGVWTVEAKCNDKHPDKVVTAKTIATKVTKASCLTGTQKVTVYSIEYAGGEFELKVATPKVATAAHDYIAGDTAWSYADGKYTATTIYYCPVDGYTLDGEGKKVWNERYTVTMTTDGDEKTGTATIQHNNSGVEKFDHDGNPSTDQISIAVCTVADASTKATAFADGTIDVTMTLKKATGYSDVEWAKIIDALGTTPTASFKAVDPQKIAAKFKATVDIVEATSKATVLLTDDITVDAKTYDLASKHVDGGFKYDNATYAPGYTVYTADIVLPEGAKLDVSGQVVNGRYDNGVWGYETADEDGFVAGKTIYQNADGSYSIKYKAEDKVEVSCSQGYDENGFLSTEAAKWTIVDSTGTTPKTCIATAVATADVAHTKADPKAKKAYTVTYDNGKTVTFTVTGKKDAHKLSIKTFEFDIVETNAAIAGDSNNNYSYTATPVIKAKLVCADCGDLVDADVIAGTATTVKSTYNGINGILADAKKEAEAAALKAAQAELAKWNNVKADVYYHDSADTVVEIGEYVFAQGEASNTVFTAAPVFKWTSTVTDAGVVKPAVTATFTSADGKKKVVLTSADKQIDIELVDAATSTYKATIKPGFIPDGYKGTVTDTHVVSLHDGHSMVLEKVEKATTTKAGYAQYYCNNDGQLYKVAIAKNDMKVSPTSKSYKVSAVKKAKKTFTIKVSNAKGTVSFKSSSKKVTVSKSGKVTVKKGTAKGTYKVTVTSKATDTYAKVTKTVSIKVK